MANLEEERPPIGPAEPLSRDRSFGEIVVGRSYGGLFENRESVVKLDGGAVSIDFGERTIGFPELASLRRNPQSSSLASGEVEESLCSPAGRPLNNVGVSVALTTSIDGARYAIATHRKGDGALTLVSGYVDVHPYAGDDHVTTRGELLSTGLKELREELLPGRIAAGGIEVDAGMLVSRAARDVLKEVSFGEGGSLVEHVDSTVCFLGAPFSGSAKQDGDVPVVLNAESSWTVRPAPLPAYLLGLHPASQVSVDGEPLEAGFVYDKCHDSGQIIFSLELELPAGSGVSLFHSETAPDGEKPGWLKEVLDPRGIVLLRLDEAGFPDGSSYWLLDGALVERSVPPDQLALSEFFSPCFVKEGRPTGIVERSSIAFDEYRAAASSLA